MPSQDRQPPSVHAYLHPFAHLELRVIRNRDIVILVRVVRLHDPIGNRVNLVIVMGLEVVNRQHPSNLFHDHRIRVRRTRRHLQLDHFPRSQNVLDRFQRDLDYPVVHHRQHRAQRRKRVLVHKVRNLLRRCCRGGIRDRPTRLSSRTRFGRGQAVDQFWPQPSINDGLDLLRGSSQDIANRPAGFLS